MYFISRSHSFVEYNFFFPIKKKKTNRKYLFHDVVTAECIIATLLKINIVFFYVLCPDKDDSFEESSCDILIYTRGAWMDFFPLSHFVRSVKRSHPYRLHTKTSAVSVVCSPCPDNGEEDCQTILVTHEYFF